MKILIKVRKEASNTASAAKDLDAFDVAFSDHRYGP